MRKKAVSLEFTASAVLLTACATLLVFNVANLHAQARPAGSYAEDRAAIEDLQARYLFALDFQDPNLYVSTFTPDGVLVYGRSEGPRGHQRGNRANTETGVTPGLRAAAARHNISNIVIKVDGSKAVSRSYWFHHSNDNPQRKGVFDGFGHYEDALVQGQRTVAVHEAKDLQPRAR